ncbi:MAG: hypothetical protein A2Y25_01895 [Candidatus Melainabacteria bacterium GWF2_37_15]|nr:MAG: hypothetical protein A2Y25_01895 [Candidatus Melainabacteria bacterium GWF2_37_15]
MTISIIISLLFISSSFCYDYYAAGKKAYDNSEYDKAGFYFAKALEKFPSNLKCRYYYAQTLINLNEFEKAQREYEKIIEASPLSYEARLAFMGISEIEKYRLIKKGIDLDTKNNASTKQKFAFKSGDTYIENALEGGQVTRWHTEKMPIKVYIQRNTGLPGYKDSYFSEIKRAMDNWVNSVGNNLIISYKITDNPDEANIRVYFVNEILKKTGKGYVTGLATPYIKGSILDYYEVKFIPQGDLYTTALHELGHALGIRGHSSNKSDIMYSAVNDVNELSSRDINTLSLLYTLDPDISNFDKDEKIVTGSAKNEKLLGSKDKLLDKKLQEAVEYTKSYPNNVLSWSHLGKAYFDLGNYENAVISYKKAIEIDPSYTSAIEGLAFTYKEMGKTTEASNLFKELISKEPRNIAFSHNYALYLMENKQYSEAKNILQNLLRYNPQAKDDENIQNLLDYVNKI